MKRTLFATASAFALALNGAPVVAQDAGALRSGLTDIGQMSEGDLEALRKLCEEKGVLPGGLSCEEVAAQPDAEAPAEAEPAPEVTEAPAEAEPAPEVTEAPAEVEPAPEVTEGPAEVEPAPEVTEAPAEVEPAPEVTEAPAEAEPAPEVTEAPTEQPVEATEAGELADALEKAAESGEAPVETVDPETADAAVRELTAQEQADAVAENDGRPAAAAAAGGDEAEPEMVEETVSEEDVRRSTEDFLTGVMGDKGLKAKDDKDDNDTAKTLAGVALLGLGAVALADILGDNEKVVSNSGDRVVVEDNGQLRVLRNDDVLLRRPGADVQTYRYNDGSTRNVVTYEDGTTVETIRAADGRVLRRSRTLTDGTEVVLFDDTQAVEQVVVNELPQTTDYTTVNFRDVEADELARALAAQETSGIDRRFSLAQVRNIDAVRRLVPQISVDTITFATNSAAIRAGEAEELAALGNAMRDMIEQNPGEVFLIEGHTDAVGNAGYNLALSDRRAESVALALTEYFQVPPENMVLQGYGESDLLIETEADERANRRAAVRRITPLLN